MSRAPFQVLVIPFRIESDGNPRYALLKRDFSTGGYWQFVAGGGEESEEPATAARREVHEEIGADIGSPLVKLDSTAMIPVVDVCGFVWGNDVLVIPEYCFALELSSDHLRLSSEHTDFAWLSYQEAHSVLKWESNKVALWELNHRLTNGLLGST
jgi:dATP pyrophosphohydrolase